jgi:hypothetical protein
MEARKANMVPNQQRSNARKLSYKERGEIECNNKTIAQFSVFAVFDSSVWFRA